MRGIIPILDGSFPFELRRMPGAWAEPDEAARLLGAETLPDRVEVPVWCYLMETDSGPGLVDAGGGTLMGKGFGGLAERLAEIGLDPGDIRTVWLTHLHGDHCGGLLDADGKAAFPAARIALSAVEAAFWFSSDLTAGLRPIAEDAQRALAPYADRIDLLADRERAGDATACGAPGHTAGHTAWLFEKKRALAAGDILHILALQLDRPDWSTVWDQDAEAAAHTRSLLIRFAVDGALTLLTGHAGPFAPGQDGGTIPQEAPQCP